MNVLLVNGSPHQFGCTYTALTEIAAALKSEGISSEFFWIGNQPIAGCTGCGSCGKTGRCIFDDQVNAFLAIAGDYDGFVFGSPVHYASMSGAMSAFMDRVFFAEPGTGRQLFWLKPAAAIVSARRAGTTAALDQMNKHLLYAQMPIISSCYWNMVHGSTPEDVRQDAEGLQIMRTLGRNMAWFLRCKDAGANAGVPLPQREPRIFTNFIR